MYRLPLIRLMIVRDTEVPAQRKIICSPVAPASIAATYLEGQDREHFIVLLLDTKHRINAIHIVTIGSHSNSASHVCPAAVRLLPCARWMARGGGDAAWGPFSTCSRGSSVTSTA
ncbi:MAG: hypothetical protein HYZ81_00570 [Nitrospinae bacterium]|nr:hypothetical protein [Nitrospinota bacterium]